MKSFWIFRSQVNSFPGKPPPMLTTSTSTPHPKHPISTQVPWIRDFFFLQPDWNRPLCWSFSAKQIGCQFTEQRSVYLVPRDSDLLRWLTPQQQYECLSSGPARAGARCLKQPEPSSQPCFLPISSSHCSLPQVSVSDSGYLSPTVGLSSTGLPLHSF